MPYSSQWLLLFRFLLLALDPVLVVAIGVALLLHEGGHLGIMQLIVLNAKRNAQSSLEHAASVLRVVLAWRSAGCVLCSSAVDEHSSSTDALQHCLQNFVGVLASVLCSSARAGAQAVL